MMEEEKSPQAIARRWKTELKLADQRELKWREKAKAVLKLYTPEDPGANSYNILWPNTETLRQAVYNSLPQPDVRRRYQDEDPLGKAVAQTLTRALEFAQDTYDFDGAMKGDVMAMLLPGRAVSRVRYVPDIASTGEGAETEDDEAQESESYEEIEWESVICERVQWDDFRILCPAKTWDDVTAIAFKHTMSREDCIEKFGEDVGERVPLEDPEDKDACHEDIKETFKRADVWEIWDKEEKQVIFLQREMDEPCKVTDDPLGLSGFFPIPRPLYAIESATTLVPACLYTQYEQQARELNRISARINRLIEGLKNRGVYDATLSEIAELTKAGDNELIPAQNVTALLDRGGLDKAIWMMPIADSAQILLALYQQREQTKTVIYDLCGIADIMRSASDPRETFGAQKIKTQWGTQRLQRMQLEVQRYIRDIIRLKAEIIAEKFQVETLAAMTLLPFPRQAEVEQQYQQAMFQWQQAAQQAMQSGQQPPPQPPVPNVITWESVKEAMSSDATRTYRVDIETDSTLSASQDADMENIEKLLRGLSSIAQGFGVAVERGAMPIEAVREIMLAVVRRAKMGAAVEDAIEKMQAPKPPADPEAGKAQAQQAIEQIKAQAAAAHNQQLIALEREKAQIAAQVEQAKQESQAQQNAHQNQLESQREIERQQLESQKDLQSKQIEVEAEARKAEMTMAIEQQKMDFERWKTEFTESTKILIAQIGAQTTMDQAAMSAQQASVEQVKADTTGDEKSSALIDMHGKTLEAIKGVMEQLARPKKIIRGADGRAEGVE